MVAAMIGFSVGLFAGAFSMAYVYEASCVDDVAEHSKWRVRKWGGPMPPAYEHHEWCAKETLYTFVSRPVADFLTRKR